MIDQAKLEAALGQFLPGQRWFAQQGRAPVRVRARRVEVLRSQPPALLRVELEAEPVSDMSEEYQFLVGLRPAGSALVGLNGDPAVVVGEFDSPQGPCWAYDALTDPELAIALFEMLAPKSAGKVSAVRAMGAEQSHTSLVFDERLVLKVFRRLVRGRSLELEMTKALTDVGFDRMAAMVAEWRTDEFDLGLIQRFLAGGAEGRALAVTSIRDLYGHGGDPAEAGGDFRAEAERLGRTTAEMHVALGKAFGIENGGPAAWADLMDKQLERISHPKLDKRAIAEVFDDLRKLPEAGPAIRTHGDYHLGQVVRADAGWYILDFEGEPSRPPEERTLTSSPLKDVAGMLRSFNYAALTVWGESASAWPAPERADFAHFPSGDVRGNSLDLANAWVERNRKAFLDGYVSFVHSSHSGRGLLPAEAASFDLVLRAYELDKAVYEVGYEMAHRPDWAWIPLSVLSEVSK
ncbi:MAG: maltokinase N-terminal cap-like domain-containing protein [Actinomycetota bacterium]